MMESAQKAPKMLWKSSSSKRRILKLTLLLTLLVSALGGSLLVNLADANPIWLTWLPRSPDRNPPSIRVHSPMRGQILHSHNVTLNFTVKKPETWFGVGASFYCIGEITSVNYVMDGKESQSLPVNDDLALVEYRSPLRRTLTFSMVLTVPEGKHTLTVSAEGRSYYMPRENWDPRTHGGVIVCESFMSACVSSPITFSVEESEAFFGVEKPAPKVTILSPIDKIYSADLVQLNFRIGEQVSWVGYSLDGQANVTVGEDYLVQHFLKGHFLFLTGNLTLTGLSDGVHSLTVYAEEDCKTGVSSCIFTVGQEARPMQEQQSLVPPLVTGSAIAITVAVGAVSLLVCFKKRKR